MNPCPKDKCDYEWNSTHGLHAHWRQAHKNSGECPVEYKKEDNPYYGIGNKFSWDNEEEKEKILIEEIERANKEIDILTYSKAEKVMDVSIKTICDFFGSWNNALEVCGIDKYSREQLVFELQKISKNNLNGKSPSAAEMVEYGDYSPSIYQDFFGSWNNALIEANFSINKEWKVDKKDLKSDIESILKDIEIAVPTIYDYANNGSYSTTPIYNFYNSWSDVLENIDIDFYEEEQKVGGYGSSWNVEKREKVRKRDKRACRVCGSSNCNGWKMDVHHINPKDNWIVKEEHEEMNDPSNLISLCRSCHLSLEGRFYDNSVEEFAEKSKAYLNINSDQEENRSIFDY
jgi:hypothetical protein